MDWLAGPDDANAVLLLQRGLAAVYLIAFLVARNQFRPLLGERGLMPIGRFVERVPFRRSPSLFHLHSSDRFVAAACWVGMAAAVVALSGVADAAPIGAVMALWALLWALHLSLANVGQLWYGFGWESLLAEAGFLAIFLGPADHEPPAATLVLVWWLLFRVEFGAGLIKMRGDRCWRDLTCLQYHHETQPMPNPLSWWFHHLPRRFHQVEVAANHVTQLVAPFLLFAPPPIRTWAAVLIVVTQAWLVLSGNFAWLNLVTMVLALGALDGDLLEAVFGWDAPGGLAQLPAWFEVVTWLVAALVVVLSWWPVKNLVSSGQKMNASFDPLRLVNTYGAFGSISRHRDEIIVEGTADPDPGPDTVWLEYEFKGKPGDVMRRPRQFAPYHLRLDWLMWFLPLSDRHRRPWFPAFLRRLLINDPAMIGLLRHNPFADEPPAVIRARRWRYRYTTPAERRASGAWWHRELVSGFVRPIRRADLPETTDRVQG